METLHQDHSQADEHNHHDTPKQGDKVTVTVDNNEIKIHRGSYTVAELKVAISVPAELALDQIVDGQFNPLEDTAHIVIKGGEQFVSHQRTGGSS